jgi:hypothetical protein
MSTSGTVGSGEIKFKCDKGGCIFVNLGDGQLSEIKCQGGDCTIYCLGLDLVDAGSKIVRMGNVRSSVALEKLKLRRQKRPSM